MRDMADATPPDGLVPPLPEQAPGDDDSTQLMAFRCARCETEYEAGAACPVCGALPAEEQCEQHPDQAAHGRCVICGRTVCRSCGSGETDPCRCEEHASIPIIEGWAQVYSTTGELEAQLLRDNLQAEGVDSQIFSQKSHIYPVDMGELSIVRLLVPVWQYAQALEVIRQHMDAEGEVLFACPSCGEAYEPGAATCGSCGAPLSGGEAAPPR